ncbi:4-phosphopantetheinyl transferase family protein [Streptomyces oceani]|uniref:4'-phosphopantetheinyl transferase domain-containing protein n=1 Tax=Streptomyces oceani TaxID=1075402 RepID=A0A1E7KLT4_9ACTN|nr:4-phosphopantetheinyl transferase family protein [Streptomyces oceani]OEV04860.1 hypothetical protein AN216_05410 [Streptomyces oceani]
MLGGPEPSVVPAGRSSVGHGLERSASPASRGERIGVRSSLPSAVAAGRRLGTRVEITAYGLWAMALGERVGRMGVSAETAPPHLGTSESRLLHATEWQLVRRAPREQRGKLATRLWVRKDAALQLLGYGLTLDPGRMVAGYQGDRGRVRLEHPDGVVSTVHVTDVHISERHVCSIATWHRPDEVRYWGEDGVRVSRGAPTAGVAG